MRGVAWSGDGSVQEAPLGASDGQSAPDENWLMARIIKEIDENQKLKLLLQITAVQWEI